MPTAKAVYHGSFNETQIYAGGAIIDSVVGTTANVDIDNCMVMYSLRGDDIQGGTMLWRANLAEVLGNVVIEWDRNLFGAGDPDYYIDWCVTEFAAASMEQNVQRGTNDNTADPTDITITAVTLDQTLFLTTFSTSYVGVPNWRQVGFEVSYPDTTTIRYAYNAWTPSSGLSQIGWQAIEFIASEVHAQHGVTNYTDSGTDTLSGFTTQADMIVLKTGSYTTEASANRGWDRVEIDSTSQISFDSCVVGTGLQNNTSWTVLEFLDATNVEIGEASMAATDLVPSTQPSFTAVDPEFSTVMTGLGAVMNGYNDHATVDGSRQDSYCTISLDGDGAGVHIEREDSTSAWKQAFAVVEWVNGTGATGISRTGVSLMADPGTVTSVSHWHKADPETTLIIFTVGIEATADITTAPTWETAGSQSFTLIDETTNSGSAGDMHQYTYGLVSPTLGAGTIDYIVDSSNDLFHMGINYQRTITTSVAAATSLLSEDVNDAGSNTSVHASAGTSGNTLLFCGCYEGLDGDPSSNATSFTEMGDQDSGLSAFYVADKLAGAPAAITVTWAATDENASHLIEILEPAVAGANRLLLINPQRMGGEL